MNIQHLDHVAISVSDLPRSIEWYQRVFGFEHRFAGLWGGVPAMLFIGETGLALFPASKQISDAHIAPPIRVLHIAFRVDYTGFVEAQDQLTELGIEFDFQGHDISHSIYFDDLDGHQLEITTYDLQN